jgi:hypothetical protein
MHLPSSIVLQDETDSNGWAAIKDIRATFEKTVQEAGWTFSSWLAKSRPLSTDLTGESASRRLEAAHRRYEI